MKLNVVVGKEERRKEEMVGIYGFPAGLFGQASDFTKSCDTRESK